MAATKVADIIVPEVFQPYVINRTAELSALYQSGIIVADPEITQLAQNGGVTAHMPFFTDLTGADEVLADNAALTPTNIGTAQDICALHNRGKAWGSNQLAKWLSGADPMRAIGDLVAAYWARRGQATLISSLKGVFAAASMSGNLHSVASESVAGQNASTTFFNASTFIDALGKLGDAERLLTAVAMHSVVYRNLKKLNLIEFIKDSQADEAIPFYQGKRVIVDDGMPTRAGTTDGTVYRSYLFGAGAVGSGRALLDSNEAVETDRDSLAGEDYLINRTRFIMHPRGVKWVGTPAANGKSPANSDLETGTNWTRVYENKQIRMVAFDTNG